MQYRPEIDGLRALAVLPVIFYHAGYSGFSGGFVGVDVFFVISGYLITSILDRDLSAGRFTLRGFYDRRIRRILPALWLVCLTCIPAAWVLMPPETMGRFAESLVAQLFFVSNVYFWLDSGYFSEAAEFKPLLHTWSLAVEEQFYVLYPLLLMLVLRRSRALTIRIIAGLSAVSLILAVIGAGQFPNANFFLLPTRVFELGAGALVALWFQGRQVGSPLVSGIAAAAGIGMIFFSIVILNEETPFPGAATLLPVVGTCLALIFARSGNLTGSLLGWSPLVLIGLISYSAYLWHVPLFVFARFAHFNGAPLPNYPLLIFLTFVLAWLTWKFVETPFRDRKVMSGKRVRAALVPIFGILLTFGCAAAATNGLQEMRIGDRAELFQETAKRSHLRGECHSKGSRPIALADACRYFVDDPSWVTFGDSHVVELGLALAKNLEPLNEGIAHNSFSNCPPRFGVTGRDDKCTDWTNDMVEAIATNPDYTTVVVSYRIMRYLYGDHVKGYPAHPNGSNDRRRAQVWQSYISTLKRLKDAGKRVVLVLQAPELPYPVDTMVQRPVNDQGFVEGISREWWETRRAYLTDRLNEIPEGVVIVDPTELICDRLICKVSDGDTFLYFDTNHLSVAGMDRVAKAVIAAAPVE